MKRREPSASAENLPAAASSGWAVALAAGLIALATIAAFSDSLAGPFIFDDDVAIVKNATIRRLWPITTALCPPAHGETVTGRPLLNLSLAVNYAISGDEVWSYHATNLAIHVFSALLLFGIVRRTFLLPSMRDRWGAAALPLAFAIALLWAVHPLQTESVTYLAQRAESLAGLFYLLTLYGFIRAVGATAGLSSSVDDTVGQANRGAPQPAIPWYIVSVLACLLGMASKEVMVSAPLLLLLYDRTFLAGSFREAWRRRYVFYLAMAAGWLLLGALVVSAGGRGGSAGFGSPIGCWEYLGTQFGAIVHYLRLCLWPHPLVLDYGTATARNLSQIVPPAIVVGLLVAATVIALWRWPKAAFLGAWFLAILAPSSSIVPVATQTVAEHRMYLPLAAVTAAMVVGGFLAGRRLARRGRSSPPALQVAGGSLVVLAAVALAALTYHRNLDYRSDFSIWEGTVANVPGNARARYNLGQALAGHERFDDAMVQYRKALEIRPDYAEPHANLGVALAHCGRLDEAMAEYRKALEIKPVFADPHYNLALALAQRGQVDEAIAHYEKALEINPDFIEARNNLANTLARLGRIEEAIVQYKKVQEIKPGWAEAHYNLGLALAHRGEIEEAMTEYQRALQLKPDYAKASYALGIALARRGRIDAAIEQFRKAVELKPDDADAHNALGMSLLERGEVAEAIVRFRKALEINPDDASARANLAAALAREKPAD